MIRNILLIFTIVIVTAIIAVRVLDVSGSHSDDMDPDHIQASDEFPRGPHRGRLLEEDDLAVEITIFESGIPPEFRVYAYQQRQTVPPEQITLIMKLERLGSRVDRFDFSPQDDYLRGNGIVTEPHSFNVTVLAGYKGKNYRWAYESYEGRTRISSSLAADAGIKTEIAGPVMLKQSLNLTGRVQTDPNRLSTVKPRFPGIVRAVHQQLGEYVNAGDTMVTIQSNESLQEYAVSAPISGLILQRNVQVGETVIEQPLFIIADLAHIWIELDVFADDLPKINTGQTVLIKTIDGHQSQGTIDWISPLMSHASQSVRARIPVDNPDGRFRPGQFIRGEVAIGEFEVPLAVRQSAVQQFRDFQVVFARVGDTYEVRMLDFGKNNDDWYEVIGGLEAGTEYVTENSYLIKADIEKSGASHDH